MRTYTQKEIYDFLKGANRDLGDPRYKPVDLVVDYSKCVIIGQQLQVKLKAAEEKIAEMGKLLQRVKETFEPFPIVSDLKAMKKFLAESKSLDAEACEKLYKKHEKSNRKLYKDIKQALSKEKE